MLVTKNLSKIINKHEPLAIENALVQLYIEQNNINVKNNLLIKKILGNYSQEVVLAKSSKRTLTWSTGHLKMAKKSEITQWREVRRLTGIHNESWRG